MATSPSDAQIRALYEDGSYDVVPHDNMRKIIAQRLTLSKQTIPHFYLTLDCDIGKLSAARRSMPQRPSRTASRPTRFRSTTSSSRRWRWRCSACPTPM